MRHLNEERLTKAALEEKVAKDLLFDVTAGSADEVTAGMPPPNPDVLASADGRRIGVEVCSLVFPTKIQASVMEDRFLRDLNAALHELGPGVQRIDTRAGVRGRVSCDHTAPAQSAAPSGDTGTDTHSDVAPESRAFPVVFA